MQPGQHLYPAGCINARRFLKKFNVLCKEFIKNSVFNLDINYAVAF
jgi:hypothetical protein